MQERVFSLWSLLVGVLPCSPDFSIPKYLYRSTLEPWNLVNVNSTQPSGLCWPCVQFVFGACSG